MTCSLFADTLQRKNGQLLYYLIEEKLILFRVIDIANKGVREDA